MAVTNNLANNTTADASEVMENFNDCLQEDGSVPMNNNVALQQKDSSGTARDLLKTDASNVLHVGNDTDTLSPRNWDGWTEVTHTWTFASANSITVPSGAGDRYKIGDKIKITQTTDKYFYVLAVADTTLTVSGGSDYTVANAAITNPKYSKQDNPQGFPDWFIFTPTWEVASFDDGSGGQPTNTYAKFCIRGNTCHIQVLSSGYKAGANDYVRFQSTTHLPTPTYAGGGGVMGSAARNTTSWVACFTHYTASYFAVNLVGNVADNQQINNLGANWIFEI